LNIVAQDIILLSLYPCTVSIHSLFENAAGYTSIAPTPR